VSEYVELKYCPFCHYDEHLQVLDDLEYTQGREKKYYWVDCDYCGARGPEGVDKADAVGEWNSWCVDPRSSWDDRHRASNPDPFGFIGWRERLSDEERKNLEELDRQMELWKDRLEERIRKQYEREEFHIMRSLLHGYPAVGIHPMWVSIRS